MKKKYITLSVLFLVALLCLCGCAKKCENCGNQIEEGKEIQIDDKYYDEACVEYCTGCNTPFVKDSGALLTYKDQLYCKDCFAKEAYPIVLEDDDYLNLSITGYDDESGMLTVVVENKSDSEISTYQEGDSAVMDGATKCTAETSGSFSFAYATVPPKETVTLFCSFRKDWSGDGWDEIYRFSEGHSFELMMHAFVSDGEYWDTNFKVTLTPDMFGYVQ